MLTPANTGAKMAEVPRDMNKSASENKEVAFRDIKIAPALNREIEDAGGPGGKGLSFRELENSLPVIGMGDELSAQAREGLAFNGLDLAPSSDSDPGHGLKEAKRIYAWAMNSLFKIFRLIQDNKVFSIDIMHPYAVDFASHLQAETDSWMQIVYTEEHEEDLAMQIVIHSLNTAIIAIRIGIALDLEREKLEGLAIRAFFHDVGMLRVPVEVVQKKGELTPEEIALIKEHPKHGYDILRNVNSAHENLANVTYQEHERHDGSGYPQGLKNGDIFDCSLVIGVADIYAALVHPRPYRPRYLPFDAVKQIIITSKGKFPNNVMKALVNEFSTFPNGIYVRLNSMEVGRVISSYKIAPLRPVVEILYDAHGKKLAKAKTVDMFKEHILQIKEAFFTEEETDKNDKPAR